MARPRKTAELPKWFDLSRYTDAGGMDAADWYVNLAIRGEIARGTQNARLLVHHVRGEIPILRRNGMDQSVAVYFHFGFDDMPSDLRAILENREPSLGITPLRADELYFFEKQLPEDIRRFGAQFVPSQTPSKIAPKGFIRPMDELLNPRLVSVFARIDLSLKDDVLLDDMRAFIASQRRAFAAIGGRQPYAEALRELGGRKSAKFRTFEKIRLLPFMDIGQWQKESGIINRPAALARALA